MILIIDNYDSFTFNMVQALGPLTDLPIVVVRHDQTDISTIQQQAPRYILISPGPKSPAEAGISCEVIRAFYKTVPILGVCLGHQCLGVVFGASIVPAKRIFHGKTSLITHQQQGIFQNLPSPFRATRYHSLMVEEKTLPAELIPNCYSEQKELMGMQHLYFPTFGVQFHPESFLTEVGSLLFQNFLKVGYAEQIRNS